MAVASGKITPVLEIGTASFCALAAIWGQVVGVARLPPRAQGDQSEVPAERMYCLRNQAVAVVAVQRGQDRKIP
jgi:hypothetical protein